VPITDVEVFVVPSTVPVDALGALASTAGCTTSTARCALLPVPVFPAVELDEGELEPDDDDDDELSEEEGDEEPDEGELPLVAVVTVEEELAGQPSRSSELSWAFAAFTAASSVDTDCSAARSAERFVGFALAITALSADLSFATFVSSVETVC
jgi:hypothetical protein